MTNESERQSHGGYEPSQSHHGPWSKTSGESIPHASAHSHHHGKGSIASCGESCSCMKGAVEIDGAPVSHSPFTQHHTESHQSQGKHVPVWERQT